MDKKDLVELKPSTEEVTVETVETTDLAPVKANNFTKYVLIGTAGAALTAGLVYLGVRLYRKVTTKKAEKAVAEPVEEVKESE